MLRFINKLKLKKVNKSISISTFFSKSNDNKDKEEHFKSFKSAMEELSQGVWIPTWNANDESIASWKDIPLKELSDEKLLVLAKAYSKAAETKTSESKEEEQQQEERVVMYDPKRAFEIYQLCHDHGNIQGMYATAICYLEGKGIKKDVMKAYEILHKILDKSKFAPAEYTLSTIYKNGIIIDSNTLVNIDHETSFKLALSACENGHPLASLSVANAYWEGKGTSKNQELALEFYKKAAKSGVVDAMLILGNIYMEGLVGTNKESGYKQKGLDWYHDAADQQDPRGYFNLALHHLSRTFIPVNNEQDTNQNENKKKEITVRIDEENFRKTEEYLKLSAAKGYIPAISNLGNLYRDIGNLELACQIYSLSRDKTNAILLEKTKLMMKSS